MACGPGSAVRIWLVLHGCHLSGAKIPLRSGAKPNSITIKRIPATVGHCGAKRQQQLLHLCQQDVPVKLTPSLEYYYIARTKLSVFLYVCVCVCVSVWVDVVQFFCVTTKCLSKVIISAPRSCDVWFAALVSITVWKLIQLCEADNCVSVCVCRWCPYLHIFAMKSA